MSQWSTAIQRLSHRFGRSAAADDLHRIVTEPFFATAAERQYDVLVHFADGPINSYQIRQWYGPLEELARHRSVAVVCWRADAARLIHEETPLPVVVIPHGKELAARATGLGAKVVLYPNQNIRNFSMLALSTAVHVFISHGESDKIYMSSNSVKAYNRYFVAGQAARDRLGMRLFNYDVASRTIEIGRPQIDVPAVPPDTFVPSPGRTVVFYAPTWEGGRPATRYGSVASHGEAIIKALVADARYQIIYRPHPRTGRWLEEFRDADAAIRATLRASNLSDPEAHHLEDEGLFGWQLNEADVMITDISAVAYDWLATTKPLIMTRPVSEAAVVDETTFVGDTRLLLAEEAPRITAILDEVIADQALQGKLQHWSQHYYGDTSPGASMNRFLGAVESLITGRDAWIERRREALVDAGHAPDGSDIFTSEEGSA